MAVVAIANRKSVLGLALEVTEGVPVVPAGATSFTALQEGFSVTPSFNVLTNAEFKSSIGKSKDEIGSEAPEASMSHYIRASGVEGQEPDYKILLVAAFGAKAVAATEYDTVAASTTASLNVDAGEGVNFQRGQALLVKDPVNGRSIRNVLAVAVDALGLAQNLAVAPGTGVALGKAVMYKVADEDHPTFTGWFYRGNGGAIEMVAGCRVTQLAITAQAGEYINGAFTIGGVSYYFNPIVILAADTKLDFLDEAITRAATITARVYKDPHDLASAIATAMNALGSANTFTCTYSNDTGKFTITSNGAIFSLLWNTGANAANTVGDKLGFLTAANDTGALTYTSDNAQVWSAAYTPDYDDASANVAKYNEIWLGDAADTTCFKAQSMTLTLANTKTDVADLCEESGKSGSLITGREVTVQIVALLKKHDADKFRRFREGTSTMFTYNFGLKSGGQWVAGKCVNLFCPTTTITSLDIADQDGLCIVNIGLSAFVDDGKPELYLNFL